MDCEQHINVVDPPTVLDTVFYSYTPDTVYTHDIDRLTGEEFEEVMPYLCDIDQCLFHISRLCWEASVTVHIQKDSTHIRCEASALGAEAQRLITCELQTIIKLAEAIENFLDNYALLRLSKKIERQTVHSLN